MNTNKIRRVVASLFLGLILSAVLIPVAAAITPSQIPLNVGISAAKPNIMLLIDNSRSMGNDVPGGGEGATTTAPNLLTGSTFACNKSREYPGGGATAASATTVITMQVFSKSAQFCPATGTCTSSNSIGFGNSSTNKCFNAKLYYNISGLGTYTGNQLNLYFKKYNGNLFDINSLPATPQKRLQIVQKAAVTFVGSLKPVGGAQPSVRLGLARFNDTTGGELLTAIGPLDVTRADTIITQINAFSANANTPLAESLSDIGHYYTSGVGVGTGAAPGYSGNLTLHPITGAVTKTVAEVFNSHNILNSTGAAQPSPIQGICQRSNVIILSDGLPSSDQTISPSFADYDGDCSGTRSTNCTTFDMKKEYAYPGSCSVNHPAICAESGGSNSSDYLDDVAQALFEMDLRPDLAKTDGKKNNIFTYTVGFADPAIDPLIPGVNPLLNDTATQGGGQFRYSADTTTLADDLDKIATDITSKISSSASVVANSAKLDANSAIFQGKFDSADWTGSFSMFLLGASEDINGNGKLDFTDTNGNGVLDSGEPTEDTNGNGVLDGGAISATPVWNAAELIPAFGDRKIFTYKYAPADTPPARTGVTFTCANLSASQKTALGIALTSSACTSTTDQGVWRLNYLRGDWSHEEKNPTRSDLDTIRSTTAADWIFRNRTHLSKSGTFAMEPPDPWLLGDIVNSNPVYVSDEDYGYAKLPATTAPEGAGYKDFLALKVVSNTAWRKMVYVGANDGMLHGFDANATGADAGKEMLAYIPNDIYGGLMDLSSPNYVHQYFVDGSPRVADAYFGGGWHTVLVGTTGAGGKAVFALDVTNPNTFSGSNVLWEISDTESTTAADLTAATGFANNMGYTLPQASIVRMNNGSWAAVVANGYGSTNDRAVLYILNIQTGDIIKAIDTLAGSATAPNGLSTPITVDTDGDRIADTIYAGDLQGNMWKFDVKGNDPSLWQVANGGAPLFIACSNTSACNTTRQPITSKPQVSGVGQSQVTGVMVYFGTGKYFETVDNNVANAQTQTFYGIWDNNTTVARGDLQAQSITDETEVGGFNLRVTTNTTVDYPSKKGWYLDLLKPSTTASDGERVVSSPLFRNGRIIFNSLTPIPPTGSDICGVGSQGTSWLMELDAFTGSRLAGAPWDINGDGMIDDKDMLLTGEAPSGKQSTIGSAGTPGVVTDGRREFKITSGSHEAKREVTIEDRPVGNSTGSRQSWRQLP